MFNKISLFVASVAFVFCGFAFAANAQNASAPADSGTEVYVKNLLLGGTAFREGGLVKGTFNLINAKASPASGVKYVIVLSTYDQGGNPIEALNDRMYGPIDLAANETRLVSFSYQLPSGIGGTNVGIRVRAISSSGFKMGWSDKTFSISGASAPRITITKAQVVVNKSAYSIEEGPTVYPGDKASYVITLSNQNASSATLTPVITFYKKDLSGSEVTAAVQPQITLAAKTTKEFTFALPVDLEPEVYVGKVEFKSPANAFLVQLSSFRYIVGGDIVTLQSATSDKKTVKNGEAVALTINYTGTPADISGDRPPHSVGSAELKVTLFNETNQPIGSASQVSDFSSGGLKNISVTATGAGKALRAEMSVVKDGKTLSTLSQNLSTLSEDKAAGLNSGLLAGIVLLVLIVLVVVMWMIRRNRATPAALIVFMVGCIALFTASSAHAFTIDDEDNVNSTIFGPQYGNNTNWRPNVFVNLPSSGQVFNTVDTYFVKMDVTTNACQNKPGKVGYKIKLPGETSWRDMGTINQSQQSSQDTVYGYMNTITCGQTRCVIDGSGNDPGAPFSVPTTPGNYDVHVRVFNDPQIAGSVINGAQQTDWMCKWGWPRPATTPSGGTCSTSNWGEDYRYIPIYGPGNPAGLPSALVSGATARGGFSASGANDSIIDNEVNFGWIEGHQSFSVSATPAPTINLKIGGTANHTTPEDALVVTSGGTSTLEWIVNNATYCEASGGWTGSKSPTTGSEQTGQITGLTSYILRCWNGDKTDSNTPTSEATVYAKTNAPTGTCPDGVSNPPCPTTGTCPDGINNPPCPTTGGTISLNCSVTPSNPTPVVGQPVTWTATITTTGLTGPFTYEWTGTDNLSASNTSSNTTNTVTKSYSRIGHKQANVTVTTPGYSGTTICRNNANGADYVSVTVSPVIIQI